MTLRSSFLTAMLGAALGAFGCAPTRSVTSHRTSGAVTYTPAVYGDHRDVVWDGKRTPTERYLEQQQRRLGIPQVDTRTDARIQRALERMIWDSSKRPRFRAGG